MNSSPPSPGVCTFHLARKRRACGMPTKASSLLCGAHLSTSTLHCPSCNTALSSARVLPRHLRSCPAVTRAQNTAQHKWCSPRCNLPLQTNPSHKTTHTYVTDLFDPAPVMQIVDRLLADDQPHQTLPEWVPVLPPLPPALTLPEAQQIHAVWADERNSLIKLEPKHFAQFSVLAASLLHAAASGPVSILELGAGRAYTSLYVAHALHLRNVPATFVAVDRAAGRLKADRAIRTWAADEQSSVRAVRRIKCDVADLLLREVDEIRESPDVRVVGKHVCGGALDVSLSAVTNFAVAEGRAAGSVRMVFACCCRRLCSWEWLGGGAQVWREWGVGERVFESVTRMAQWGLDQKHAADKAEIGRKCRLLIDTARVKWLRSRGWEAYVGEYTTASPENACIAAVWRGMECSAKESLDEESLKLKQL